jgi:hypothetical protein
MRISGGGTFHRGGHSPFPERNNATSSSMLYSLTKKDKGRLGGGVLPSFGGGEGLVMFSLLFVSVFSWGR